MFNKLEYNRQWSKNHPYSTRKPTSRLLWAARRRAKESNLEFNITKEDIHLPATCPYLCVLLTWHSPKGTSRTTIASLDRIDNTKGYVKGNVEVISHLANSMKSNASPQELVLFAKEILKRYENSSL